MTPPEKSALLGCLLKKSCFCMVMVKVGNKNACIIKKED